MKSYNFLTQHQIVTCILIKFLTHILHDRRVNHIDRSEMKVTIDKYKDKLVNTI